MYWQQVSHSFNYFLDILSTAFHKDKGYVNERKSFDVFSPLCIAQTRTDSQIVQPLFLSMIGRWLIRLIGP